MDFLFDGEIAEEIPDLKLDGKVLEAPDSHLVEVVDDRPRVTELIRVLVILRRDSELHLFVDIDFPVLQPWRNVY